MEKQFSYETHKGDKVTIYFHGRPVTQLKGKAAVSFQAKAERADADALQHLMARATGNFKRGNER